MDTAPFLGVAGGSPTVVLIHGGTSTVPKLQAALPGANVAVVYREGLSSGYSEVSGLAKEYPTLRGLLAKYAPSWQPGTPLVVLGYSAGGWALRYYLRDATSRGDVSAAIFLDSLYGAPGDKCDLSPYGGVVEFAKLANAEPDRHRLIMTYSQAHPAPGICSQTIAKAYGGPGVFVRPAGNADHTAQQGVAGPAVVKELVAPWIGGAGSGSGSPGSTSLWWGVAAVAVGLAGVVWWSRGGALKQMEENPQTKRWAYHGTSADLLPGIARHGLLADPPTRQGGGAGRGIFISPSAATAARYGGSEDLGNNPWPFGVVLRFPWPTGFTEDLRAETGENAFLTYEAVPARQIEVYVGGGVSYSARNNRLRDWLPVSTTAKLVHEGALNP